MVGWTGLPPNFEAQLSIGGCHISPLPPPCDSLNVPRDMCGTLRMGYLWFSNLDQRVGQKFCPSGIELEQEAFKSFTVNFFCPPEKY